MNDTFGFDKLVQLATAKMESQVAANLLATRLGSADGIVQCIRAAASLLDEVYLRHASHEMQIEIAVPMRDRYQLGEHRPGRKQT
jgi:hypothetical protein